MSIKALVVEDAAFTRSFIKRILGEMGIDEIEEAGDGNAAVKKAKEFQPSIVTLDINMPNMDGIEALPKILEASPDSKVIMCSSSGQHVMVTEAFKLGAFDFIVKPLDRDRVLQAIKKATE